MKCKQIGRDKELFELTIGRDLPCRELETERDVTNTGNGEQGTGNGSLGTNVQRQPA